jgi:hypothetical protein
VTEHDPSTKQNEQQGGLPLTREELRDRARQLAPAMLPTDPFVLASLDPREMIRLLAQFGKWYGANAQSLVEEKACALDAEWGTETHDADAPTDEARDQARRWFASLRPDIDREEASLRDAAEYLWRRTHCRELLQAACVQAAYGVHLCWAWWELGVEQAMRRHERRVHSHAATAAASGTARPRVRARPRERRERRARSPSSPPSGESDPADDPEDAPVGGPLAGARRAAA